MADKIGSVVRDVDPSDNVAFFRIKLKKEEIMLAADKTFILIFMQTFTKYC